MELEDRGRRKVCWEELLTTRDGPFDASCQTPSPICTHAKRIGSSSSSTVVATCNRSIPLVSWTRPSGSYRLLNADWGLPSCRLPIADCRLRTRTCGRQRTGELASGRPTMNGFGDTPIRVSLPTRRGTGPMAAPAGTVTTSSVPVGETAGIATSKPPNITKF